ncbi:hypothetical protein [Hymenobacter norwichensis]|uniref:hypothetical protein n=1 Tax=Hymenobacter norwichensis TaxID=223903 RepID=UPI0003B78CE2|nr:hypothetical protein [Hymenobacter norwichensis]
MSKNQNKQAGLEADIEHLNEEIATIELNTAHAQGAELQQMLRDQKELQETLDNKKRQLLALNKENRNQWASILAMAIVLLLAACTKKLPTFNNQDFDMESWTDLRY